MRRHWLRIEDDERLTYCGIPAEPGLYMTSTAILVTCPDCYTAWNFEQGLRHATVEDFEDAK